MCEVSCYAIYQVSACGRDSHSYFKRGHFSLPFETEVKFLGMILDAKLTWSSHIAVLKRKVKTSVNILKVVSGFSWGADKKSLKLYDSLCRSKLDYGYQFYSSSCKTLLSQLDVVHNTGLRLCSGAFKTSPIESICRLI